MDVDTAGRVGEASRLAQGPHQPLQDVDVLIVEQDGADQFHTALSGRGSNTSPGPLLTENAAVVHTLPDSSVWCFDLVGVIVVVGQINRAIEILRDNVCRLVSGDTCKLNFYAEFVAKHLLSALLFLRTCCHRTVRGHPRVCLKTASAHRGRLVVDF